jgi:hypothetical protein
MALIDLYHGGRIVKLKGSGEEITPYLLSVRTKKVKLPSGMFVYSFVYSVCHSDQSSSKPFILYENFVSLLPSKNRAEKVNRNELFL